MTAVYVDTTGGIVDRRVDVGWLARAPAFRLLAPAQLRAVLALSRAHWFRSGAVMYNEGDRAGGFHLLLSGTVRFVRATAEGEQVIVLHVASGEVFGIGAPLRSATRQETAIAAETCHVLIWPGALWQDFADRYIGFGVETLRSFGGRSDEMMDLIVELTTKQVEPRIACALLRLVRHSGRTIAVGIEIGFPVTRQHIAEMTGTTLHTASRVLSGWERLGMIESSRRHVVITDPHRLVIIATANARGLPSVQVGPSSVI